MVTYTSIEMRHTTIVLSNSCLKFHVIVSGYSVSMNATLPSLLKGNSNLDLLKLLWVRRLFLVKWNSTQALQCPREGAGLGTMAIFCSMCLLMFPICHTLRREKNGVCGCKSHCWHTFPQGNSSTGPHCDPKQHVIGWVCRAKPKLCEHEMLWVHLWCGCQGNP